MKMIKLIKSNNTLTDEIKDVLNYIQGKPHKGDYGDVYIVNDGYGAEIDQWFDEDNYKTHEVEFDIDFTHQRVPEPTAYDWNPVTYDEAEIDDIAIYKIDGVDIREGLDKNSEFYNMVSEEFQKNYDPEDYRPEEDPYDDF